MSRRAFVSGATGGLGQTLVPLLLASGYEVVATGRDAHVGAALVRQGAIFRSADLRSADLRDLIGEAQVVFHLAALSSPWGRLADFTAINVTATERLIEAAGAAGCVRFVHASTPSIYAEPRARIGIEETSPPARAFANSYAATKYAAERLVLAADSPAMRTVVLRPRAIVGPDDQVLLPRLKRVIGSGKVALPGGGSALIELTDVRDVAAAFLAADRVDEAGGQAINISGGQPRTVRAIVEAVCQALGVFPKFVDVPTPVALGAAWLAEVIGHVTRKEPAVTRYAVTTLAFSQTFDLSLARSLLCWEARFSPEAAIAFALSNGKQNDA